MGSKTRKKKAREKLAAREEESRPCSPQFPPVLFSCLRFLNSASLRSCPLPIFPLSLSREEDMIHFFVGSHVKKPESGLFSDWIGNNTDDLRCSNWPKCRHPLVVVDFSLQFCLRHATSSSGLFP